MLRDGRLRSDKVREAILKAENFRNKSLIIFWALKFDPSPSHTNWIMFTHLGSKLLFLLALSSWSLSAYSQDPAKIVFWSNETKCGQKNQIITLDDDFSCSGKGDGSSRLMILRHNDLLISVRAFKDKKYFLLKAEIKNNGDRSVFIHRPSWMVAQYVDEGSFLKGDAPILFEQPMTPPEEISTWQSTASPGAPPHSPIWTNPARPPSSSAPVGPRTSARARGSNYVPRGRGFYSTTLKSGVEVAGFVYFRYVKESAFKILFAEIGDTKYVFQFHGVK